MSAALLFDISQTMAIIGWGLLIFIPSWKSSTWIIQRLLIPMLLSVLYVSLFIANIGAVEGGFGSLGEIRSLFQNDYLLLVGWVHYLAFDLFVGTWISNHARENNYPRVLVISSLIFTLVSGPFGFLLYYVFHAIKKEEMLKLR